MADHMPARQDDGHPTVVRAVVRWMAIGCMPDANRAVNVCDINGQQNHQTRISIDHSARWRSRLSHNHSYEKFVNP